MGKLTAKCERAFLVKNDTSSVILEVLADRPVKIKRIFGGNVKNSYWRIYVLCGPEDSIDRIESLMRKHGHLIDVFKRTS